MEYRGGEEAVYARCSLAHEVVRVNHHFAAILMSYVSVRQHTSAYVSIRQHTSEHVSIRQHTSAHVSIRQHTSAYLIDARVFVDLKGESEDPRRVSRERLGIHLYSTSMYEDHIFSVCQRTHI
jgi:hypothetical protein